MCASLRPFQNCLQIDSSVNIKAVQCEYKRDNN